MRDEEKVDKLEQREVKRLEDVVRDKRSQISLEQKFVDVPDYDDELYLNYNEWYCTFTFAVEFCMQLSEKLKKAAFARAFKKYKKGTVHTRIVALCLEFDGMTCDELASDVSTYLDCNSNTHYKNVLRTLERHDKETLTDYALRTEKIFNASLPISEFVSFKTSGTYNSLLMDHFTRGIRNDAIRQEIGRKDSKTIQQALHFAKAFVETKTASFLDGQHDSAKILMQD